jgi:oxygen-independent coproporphyrinogen-3 oxidase
MGLSEGARPQAAAVPPGFARHAERNLPRYTSYPTALAFNEGVDEAAARAWAGAIDAGRPISVYVHIPFCDQLCWYCGCHTTVPNTYRRIAAYLESLHREIDLWADALGAHAGAAHLHFGGGSPNALRPQDFADLAAHLRRAFRLEPGAEFAVELDPRALTQDFIGALADAGVNRTSLGVQTFDVTVQQKVNRIQPLDRIAWAMTALADAGVSKVNFDLMYGLPAQTPASVAETARLAADLGPDRIAIFGYAHVPWFKKHQAMIQEADLAGLDGRWAQAEAADAALHAAGYHRIGLDHYARADDELLAAARAGGLHRNFQGYTIDPAQTLVPLGASSIGAFREGFVQNARATDVWAAAIAQDRLPVERGVEASGEDRLRARVIELLMCELEADVGEVCDAFGRPTDALDPEIEAARGLQADGLCVVDGRTVLVRPEARRLVRAVAACFDARLPAGSGRHSKAV